MHLTGQGIRQKEIDGMLLYRSPSFREELAERTEVPVYPGSAAMK
jgi:hypothetical protein